MRLGTIRRRHGGTQAVRVAGAATYLLPFSDVGALLREVRDLGTLREAGDPGPDFTESQFAPLVTRPGKLICVGLNYRTHIVEMGRETPSHPTLFAKFAESLVGSQENIEVPVSVDSLDWEAELAVVVGRPVRHAAGREALDSIAGYTVANDISVREFQRRTTQWLQGKTFEHTTPLGPVLVTPDEVDHASDLAITCTVDGIERQASRTSDLIFSPVDLVSYVSRIVTLVPGDVILTGTPGGVGAGMEPPTFLEAGQQVTTSIEGIGTCVNECVAMSYPNALSSEGESA